ncbi:hypothetical protein FisN_5Lu530 [Fistulifera solaris]|uniref:Uncharacterized protein n=1 Tax=Fistulifera solaris TaxID=1519565 RepID=A0A1Z5KGH6_FISSO|nr:hypothetical protein FisN_5Lu530 [Fistulifera solaris]|eukprot:GAX25414.1 hypothetical protein FisN_5Lu530 [Fistulifera solaris]
MRRARRESTIDLPSFAKLVKPRRRNRLQVPLSLPEHEQYLRTRSFHFFNRQLDLVWQETLEEASEPFHEALDRILQKETAPAETTTRQSTGESDTFNCGSEKKININSFMFEPSNHTLSRQLLPVLAIHGPPYLLDRKDWMHHLVQANKTRRPTCCTVWLRSSFAVNTSLQEELRSQCFDQEPDLPASLQNVDRKPITETLVEWARETCRFHEIVVFLDMDLNFSDAELQDFILWMTERRSIEGLPLNLVLLVPHGIGRCLDIQSTSQGNGIRMNHIRLPSSEDMMEKFCAKLYLRHDFPILFPAETVQSLEESFQHNNKSPIDIMQKLKSILAHIFCQRWSFLLGSAPDERARVRWFLNSTAGRALAPAEISSDRVLLHQWLNDLIIHRRVGCIAMRLNAVLRQNENKQATPLLFIPGRKYSDEPATAFSEEEKRRAFHFLVEQRNRLRSPSTDSPTKDTASLQEVDALNELIILCAASISQTDMLRSLAEVQRAWSDHVSAFVSFEQLSTSTRTQPRRQSLRGFMQSLNTISDSNLVTIAAQMFELFDNRVSMSRNDWFVLFRNAVAIDASQQKALEWFAYGFFQLKLCGLLKSRNLNQKSEVRYEKAMVIWCYLGKSMFNNRK